MSKKFEILIIEDDLWFAEILQYHLQLNPDNKCTIVDSEKEAKTILKKKEFDLLSLDYNLNGQSCEKLFSTIIEKYNTTPIVIISGQEDIEKAIEMLKMGACDYFTKDENVKDRLWHLVEQTKEKQDLKKEIKVLKKIVKQNQTTSNSFIGNSQEIEVLKNLISKSYDNDITVSIKGETGTGKEVIANLIHNNSTRSEQKLVALNMGAIPKDLMESELFGHEKGAFTGANQTRIGKFEEANGGTLFLDEIAELDLEIQAKLLRVLQEREISRLGSNKTIKIDVRIIIATHQDLSQLVQDAIVEIESRIISKENLPQVILLDINMPVMNGWDFIEYFPKNHFSNNNIKLFMYSSSNDINDIKKSERLNTNGYIKKPLSAETVKSIIYC